MSQSDSFIEEVTEEVRRDQMIAYARRYGWIAAVVIVGLIGAVAFFEYRNAQAERAAQATGDAIIAALNEDGSADRAEALGGIDGAGEADVVIAFLRAGELAQSGNAEAAIVQFDSIAARADLPLVYRQLATFKSLALTDDTAARRAGFEALAAPGVALRLLAEEQLALLDIEAGATDAAIARLTAIIQDAEATPDLQQRAVQVIVALGGDPDLEALGLTGN